ncbi:hypothetical protein ASG43_05590 [Aureimonas sp. Leaf454]|uniref:GumC family protein n=1 Tax=Aureimonas sp. Leaf454 TaxID=1736381 RepID=UPI0006FFA368|nr:GumC family protein [Aureimonas sp. Leaf454]KQT50750.1 hypothetical protein ASG43_05590 [Aureimonas sp. Leaf454]
MAMVPMHEKDVDIDIGHLVRAVWRRKLTVLLSTVAFAGGAFALCSLVPPVYKSETQIVVEDRESTYTRPATNGGASDSLSAESVESQVSLMTSDQILGDVADRFRLSDRAEYAPDPSLLDRIITRVQPASRVTSGEVIETMHKKLNVYRKENTRVLVVEFSSHDPALARDVPNAIADEYLARQKGALLSSNTSATGWLETEIADLREAVKAAEQKVAAFRTSSDLLVGQNQSVLATQQLSEMASELSRTRASRAAAEGRAASIRDALKRGRALDSAAEVLGSPTVQALRERQVTLRSEIADLSTTLLDNHPRLRSLRSQLRDIDTEIAGEAVKVQSSLETEADSARQREAALAAEMSRLKTEASRAGSQEVELRSLEREADAQSQLLESYLTRYREAVARGARDYLPVDARVFSEARLPAEPYFPKIVPITAAAGVAGFLISVLGLLVVEIFSGRGLAPLRREEDGVDSAAAPAPADRRNDAGELPVPTGLAVPATAAAAVSATEGSASAPLMPAPEQTSPAMLAFSPRERVAIAPGDLADAVLSSGIRTVLVLEADAERDFGGLALVRALAARGANAVILDFGVDFALSEAMGVPADAYGISDYIDGSSGLSDILYRDLASTADAIVWGRDGNGEGFDFDRFEQLFAAIGAAYDCAVVDGGTLPASGLLGFLDEEAAIVVAASWRSSAVQRLAELAKAGQPDALVMSTRAVVAPQKTEAA